MSIRRHTAYNLIGSVAPLAASLITVPLYLALIGEARYGVLAVAWLFLGYFGFFDLGLGRATAQRIAALRDGTDRQRADAFGTALGLNAVLGTLGGLIIWPMADMFFGTVFKIDDAMRLEIRAAVPWLALAVPVATMFGVMTGALQGRERFLDLNLISTANSVLFQVTPLMIGKLWGVELTILLPAALFAQLVTTVVLYARCRKLVLCGHPVSFVRTEAGQLLRFGGWITVSSLISPMMVVLDRFIIGAMLGAKAVSHYTVPFQLADRTGIVPFSLSSALFPRLVGTPREEEQRVAIDSLRAIASVMTPVMALGIMLMEPFLSWWITPSFAEEAGPVGRILLLGYWINALSHIPYVQLQARGRPDLLAKFNLLELLPYFGLLYIALNTLGLIGAAVAFSLRILADFVLRASFSGVLRGALRLFPIPMLSMATAFLISTQLEFWSREWLGVVVLHFVLTAIFAWRQAPSKLQDLVIGQYKKYLRWSI